MVRQFAFVLLVVLAGATSTACTSFFDPSHADAVEALGPEANGERPGPSHRPGQPCGVCHGGQGPGPELLLAGTVYARQAESAPAVGVVVKVTDASGATASTTTNRSGNFVLGGRGGRARPGEAAQPTSTGATTLVFPIKVEISGDGATQSMKTVINRDRSCATCHTGTGDLEHMPAVFLRGKGEP